MDSSFEQDIVDTFDICLSNFGRSVTYRPASGTGDLSIDCIFGFVNFSGDSSELERDWQVSHADRQVCFLSDSDVSEPVINDKIIDGSNEWRVLKIKQYDIGKHWMVLVEKRLRGRR